MLRCITICLLFLSSQGYFIKEEPCWGSGGNCLPYTNCGRQSSAVSGKCPSQASNIKCCLPYQESECQSAGGSCQREDKSCAGSYKSGLCPTQYGNIRCCVGGNVEGACTAAQIAVHSPYPSTVSSAELDSALTWAYCGEGKMYTTGYCPTGNSGPTIGVGIDIGHQDANSLRSHHVSECIIKRVEAFFGKRCSSFSGASSMKLSQAEAESLTKGFIVGEVVKAKQYYQPKTMDTRALDVLTSLTHWTGSLCKSSACNPSGDRFFWCIKGTNYLCNAIKKSGAKNADIKEAVEKSKGGYSQSYIRNRMDKEIDHLDGKMCGDPSRLCTSC